MIPLRSLNDAAIAAVSFSSPKATVAAGIMKLATWVAELTLIFLTPSITCFGPVIQPNLHPVMAQPFDQPPTVIVRPAPPSREHGEV